MNNQELDSIGKQLFAASRLTEAEIDRIASGPDMFDGVRRRISQQVKTETRSARPFAIPRFVFGLSLVALFMSGVFALYLKQDQTVASNAATSEFDRSGAIQPVRTVKGFTQAYATFLDEEEEVVAPAPPRGEAAVQRETRRPQPRVERASYTPAPENEFVAVTYVGDGAESTRGGRVIRVDMPRSTLFAMGFPVSLENESPTVKADLLIGPDGATRAVRLVE